MTALTLLYLVCFHVAYTHGSGCMTLDGAWYNQLGSEMLLNHTQDGELYGEYRTSVERETGSSGYGHSDIIGACPYNTPGATFAFAVLFNKGASVTAWTGQCLVCDGEEVLITSWLLREHVDSCLEKWKSTRIGQDKFTRKKIKEKSISSLNNVNSRLTYHNHVKRSSLSVKCGLAGTWYNEVGSEIILQHGPNNYITGEYRTAVEVSKGSAGTTHSKVYGLGNVYSGETTFALFVVWRHGASVTGWVGQCHFCGVNKTETLEMNWLLRGAVEKCDDNWKTTNYGQNSFTRHEQKYGPRKRLGIHTPQQAGEDDIGPNLDERLISSCPVVHFPVVYVILIVIMSVLVTQLL